MNDKLRKMKKLQNISKIFCGIYVNLYKREFEQSQDNDETQNYLAALSIDVRLFCKVFLLNREKDPRCM